MKIKYRIGVPNFDATMCTLRIGDETRQIGRRKAKDMVFQAILDGDYVKLDEPIHIEGTTMQMITIIDREELNRAMAEYKQEQKS